ncbi:MAG TPA: TIGR03617 family F420-dependent LLM class oxidoreductase [Candidatus Dormibacteraeota bacterium]|nr:TIGR03617 family F420-dependent LLM class oxidoreductase [Candidatus Dormibacteraeota bacterium]
MLIDGGLTTLELTQVPAAARDLAALGYDGLFTFEGKGDPFLPLVLAAEHASGVTLGTAVALAFPRSPMHLAYIGHDLQAQSRGRFVLGLGAQIRTHIEKRFSAAYDHPVARMRELVLALRAIWRCWYEGERLDFRGRFYRHTLMTPIFEPAPHSFGPPPVYLAGVQPRMTAVAGEVADGLIVHPFNSRRFLERDLLPALEQGCARGGRPRAAVTVMCQALVATGFSDAERELATTMVRGQIAFYASTPAYRPVLEAHGWGPLQEELHALSKRGEWGTMGDRISDEMLATFAAVGTPEEIPAQLRGRYGGIADRLMLVHYASLEGEARGRWREMLAAVRG